MATAKQIFLACWFCVTLAGCVTSPTYAGEPRWIELTGNQLRVEVETKSRKDQVWNYSGSSDKYHYFYRETARKFTGKRLYYKVPKADVQGIPRSREVPFDGKAVSRSFAFSQMAKDRSGFTHSLSRGLVDNVLIPSP